MAAPVGKPTPIKIPFSSLEDLQKRVGMLLSENGFFIETKYPPAVGTILDVSFLVGPEKKEVVHFLAACKSPEAVLPNLKGRQGIQLEFMELFGGTRAIFASIHPHLFPMPPPKVEVPAEPVRTEEEASFTISDEQFAIDAIAPGGQTLPGLPPSPPDHQPDLPEPYAPAVIEQTSEPMDAAEDVVALEEADIVVEGDELPQQQSEESLAESLPDFTMRPDLNRDQDMEFEHYTSEIESPDDMSKFQGQAGFEVGDLIFGIDLGTCNSCVAVFKDGEARVLADDKGNRTTPSVVSYMEDGKILVGSQAVANMSKYPRTSVFGAKRFIGRNYHSKVVQNLIRFFPYKLVPDENNHTAIDIFGKAISLQSISAEILKHMVSVGQEAIKEETNKVIVTVPAYYSDNQRQAVKDAGVLAGLNVLRIINEPTAAALAVGFNKNMQKRLLVFDLGGGTFDVSILEIKDNSFRVVATGGDTFLGGEDFDNRLVKWVLETSREEGVYLAKNPVTFERVKKACERAKCELSTKMETGINLPYIQTADGKTINFQKLISREQLVKLTRDLVERSIMLTDEVLSESKLTIADMDEIILNGGMTRMPFVHNSVHQHYNKKPYGDVNPDEAVAMGAALLGGEMMGKKGVQLVDVLSMSIGIALPRNRFKPILPKNIPVPCSKSYKIMADLSKEYTIDVFQGDSEKCDENEYLGTLVFSDHIKGGGKNQALQIEFGLSPECLLKCVIKNPATGKSENALLITHDTPPSAKLT